MFDSSYACLFSNGMVQHEHVCHDTCQHVHGACCAWFACENCMGLLQLHVTIASCCYRIPHLHAYKPACRNKAFPGQVSILSDCPSLAAFQLVQCTLARDLEWLEWPLTFPHEHDLVESRPWPISILHFWKSPSLSFPFSFAALMCCNLLLSATPVTYPALPVQVTALRQYIVTALGRHQPLSGYRFICCFVCLCLLSAPATIVNDNRRTSHGIPKRRKMFWMNVNLWCVVCSPCRIMCEANDMQICIMLHACLGLCSSVDIVTIVTCSSLNHFTVCRIACFIDMFHLSIVRKYWHIYKVMAIIYSYLYPAPDGNGSLVTLNIT